MDAWRGNLLLPYQICVWLSWLHRWTNLVDSSATTVQKSVDLFGLFFQCCDFFLFCFGSRKPEI